MKRKSSHDISGLRRNAGNKAFHQLQVSGNTLPDGGHKNDKTTVCHSSSLQLLLSTFNKSDKALFAHPLYTADMHFNGKGSADLLSENASTDTLSHKIQHSVGNSKVSSNCDKAVDDLVAGILPYEREYDQHFSHADAVCNCRKLDFSDQFDNHFNCDLSSSLLEVLSHYPVAFETYDLYWPKLHNLKVDLPLIQNMKCNNGSHTALLDSQKKYVKPVGLPSFIKNLDWNELHVKTQIQRNIKNANGSQLPKDSTEDLTILQKEIFSIINNYQDLYYPERNLSNGEEIRFVYCLHAVNHILKARLRILHHNEKLKKENHEAANEFRDQGLVRPKVLILVPFKESCLRIVQMISSLLIENDKGNIINKTRFHNEFTGSELIVSKKKMKPEDYEKLFMGNIDDNFRIGLSVTKKCLKLYSDFYSSDMIIASPLGLRMVIGAQGDKNRDFDFLASMELIILDQTEVFLMQNWDHLLLVFDHLHLQPKECHGTDFSRIRSWVLNGWTKYYRQTVIFSSITAPEINALYNRRCFNYSGKIRITNPVDNGSISLVVPQLSHVFQRFTAESANSACDARFKFFTEKVLPQYKDPSLAGILIYVPSYFDYVRIRNHLKREEYSFVQICEYSKVARIARARDKFFHNETRFMLYSERFHFFRRITLKGIRHIIFYQPPRFPHFYSELCNLMKEEYQRKSDQTIVVNESVTTLYCKYDMYQLAAIVRSSRAIKMLASNKEIHMFSTG